MISGAAGVNAERKVDNLLNQGHQPGKILGLFLGVEGKPRIHIQKSGAPLSLLSGQLLYKDGIPFANRLSHVFSRRIDLFADDLHPISTSPLRVGGMDPT